jgi:hypothetical protein
MTELYASSTAPPDEQKICVTCGFCCDGTLFLHAYLDPGEREGGLPLKMEEASFTEEGKDFFRQPCYYFSGKCTIYDKKKAHVCSSYRCQLLYDLAGGKISADKALELVQEAMRLRDVVLNEYRGVTGKSEKIAFRQMLVWLGRLQKSARAGKPLSDELEILIARCNIFEALLTRHFRSEADFEKLIMK